MSEETLQANWILKDNAKTVGIELAKITLSEGINVNSLSVGILNEHESFSLEYYVLCDKNFENQEFKLKCYHHDISAVTPGRTYSLYLKQEGDNWKASSATKLKEIKNAGRFVDISSTPFTNYFPIEEMLGAHVEKKTFEVIYVQIPTLEISLLSQTYESIGQNKFKYISETSKHEYIIEVDSHGLVKKYGNFWEGTIEKLDP